MNNFYLHLWSKKSVKKICGVELGIEFWVLRYITRNIEIFYLIIT